jgi:hypothetical protein
MAPTLDITDTKGHPLEKVDCRELIERRRKIQSALKSFISREGVSPDDRSDRRGCPRGAC